MVGALFLMLSDVRATHIVGGEIYYNYLGNNNYEIILKVYRDCGPTNVNGTGFDPNASVGIYRTSNGQLINGNFTLPLANATVDFVPVELENPCFVLPPNVCVQRAVYTETINLPAVPGGYTLVYQRCCRNPSIVNLVSPEDAGATFTTQIPPPSVAVNNSSAQFTNFPPVALCANAEFFFDHSATDVDGDELVYELCTPFLGGTPDFPAPVPPLGPPFTPVMFDNGYSASYPIDSSPEFAIDATTGLMTGTATQLGQYVLGVCVSEYRDGVLINTTNRDFQFNVTVCDPNIVASIPELPQVCAGAPVQFENNSTNASFFFWDFGVEALTTDTSSLEAPVFSFPGNGTYTVTLIANPGWPCADTVTTQYTSLPTINPVITVGDYECISDGDYYDFSATATVGQTPVIQWNFGVGSVPQFSNEWNPQNVKMNPESSSMNVIFTVTDNGCIESDEEVIENPPDPVAAIAPQTAFCDGFEYAFQNNSLNTQQYYWDFGFGTTGSTTVENPVVTFPDTGVYNIKLLVTAPYSCSDSTSLELYIYGLLDPFFPPQPSQCFEGNSFDFTAMGASTDDAVYSWEFGSQGMPASSGQPNPQNVTFSEPNTYSVTLTISENGCVESYTDEVWVADNFEIEFDWSESEGCPPLALSVDASAQSESPVFFQWELSNSGNEVNGNGSMVNFVLDQPGYYDLGVTAFTTTGCVESESWFIEDAVQVYHVPVPGFSISPQVVNILSPQITISDLSVGSVECNYFMSDGAVFNACNFDYVLQGTGAQTITQYVINEIGCTASVSGVVIVEGYVLHAPNSFTPNGDGVNDFWIPVTAGITSYDLTIYNRWGDMIFQSNDPALPWLGQAHDGEHFAPDGVYQYMLTISDSEGLPHDFKGHIVLTR